MIKTEIRIDTDDVRIYCINNERFTRGNNTQYEDMFSYIRKFNKTQNFEALKNACVLIVKCSDLSAYGQTFEENVNSIAYDLINACGHTFIEF